MEFKEKGLFGNSVADMMELFSDENKTTRKRRLYSMLSPFGYQYRFCKAFLGL